MQPLLRHATRSAIGSTRVIRHPKSAHNIFRGSSVQVSICLQCQFRSQRRHFADDMKPKSPPNSPENLQYGNNGTSSSDTARPELPSASEDRRSAASKRLSNVMDHLQGNIFLASQRLNDLTGYSGIEALKRSISILEKELESCQEAVRTARLTYKTTIADRAASQREVTTLLARKDTWTPVDLERFTSLYRSDHGNEQAVQEAASKLAETERLTEQAASKLSTSILSRYHEEQIWSDKIRRMSTWGTWGLMGVNVLIFLVFQFGFEPWRRRRLVRGFEEKVQEALQREKEKQALAQGDTEGLKYNGEDEARLNGLVAAGVQELETETEDGPEVGKPACNAVAAIISHDALGSGKDKERPLPQISSGVELLKRPDKWKAGILDLFSGRQVSLKKQDVTIIAIEGAASGAAVMGLIMFMLRPN